MQDDGFTRMIDAAQDFFARLERNNSKAWFDPQKAHYTEAIKKPAELFAGFLAEDLSRLSGTTFTPKLFRIYRDVRFSKDKTPLNAHLHILWSRPGNSTLSPSVFFACTPTALDFAIGIVGLKGPDLARYRATVDSHGDELQQIIDESGMTRSTWGPEPLKRVPKPYDADHPHADLLKQKSLVLQRPLGEDWRDSKAGLIGAVKDAYAGAKPLDDFIRAHMG